MRRTIHDVEIKNLINLANDAKQRAYAPYSNLQSGSCIKGASGAYYLGCNVENASFSATICAERMAIYKAISEAERTFDVMSIISSSDEPALPCGTCLQVLSELCDPDMPIICANQTGKYQIYFVGDLLPHAFSSEDIK